ncbi:hypothetical protein TNCV_4778461 [Trichonephila clavipes]|nr:hypothetical protein TNCV_4778461 [Trichonephila clavipes]
MLTQSEDISTDSIIERYDYLAICEIWMVDPMPENVNAFDLRPHCNTRNQRSLALVFSIVIIRKGREHPKLLTLVFKADCMHMLNFSGSSHPPDKLLNVITFQSFEKEGLRQA